MAFVRRVLTSVLLLFCLVMIQPVVAELGNDGIAIEYEERILNDEDFPHGW